MFISDAKLMELPFFIHDSLFIRSERQRDDLSMFDSPLMLRISREVVQLVLFLLISRKLDWRDIQAGSLQRLLRSSDMVEGSDKLSRSPGNPVKEKLELLWPIRFLFSICLFLFNSRRD